MNQQKCGIVYAAETTLNYIVLHAHTVSHFESTK